METLIAGEALERGDIVSIDSNGTAYKLVRQDERPLAFAPRDLEKGDAFEIVREESWQFIRKTDDPRTESE